MKLKSYIEYTNSVLETTQPFNKVDKELETNNHFLKSKKEIKDWLDEMEVKNYIINEDSTVDVKSGVILSHKKLNIIPIKFNNVEGSFWCNSNNLQSLIGCPTIMGGELYCSDNQLITLYGCPNSVISLNCCNNNLTSLHDCPNIIKKTLYCIENKLTSLTGLNPKYDLYGLFNFDKPSLIWSWLETNLSSDPSLIKYNIEWIKEHLPSDPSLIKYNNGRNNEHLFEMPKSFEEKFGYLLEIEDYQKNI